MNFGSECSLKDSGYLTGNHAFPNFIGFSSNPLQSIDPRAMTAIYPLFGSEWVSPAPPVPTGDFQVYGPALTVALSDRFAVGLNQGGYASADFNRNRFPSPVARPSGAIHQHRDCGGERSGLLNIGGFAQYTFIEDVPNQFLLTGGVRLDVPCGSHEVFQGSGPANMAPYLTAGKEFGEYHVLGTVGYQFPLAGGSDLQLFYANLHLDRRVFGCLYPLVEFNCIYGTTNVSFGLDSRLGFLDFGNFEATGNIVTMAVGANLVIIPERLEFGAVYTKPIATRRDFEADGMIVKMVLRY